MSPVLSRDSYGRLIAILASRAGDVGLAEDALADAQLAALQSWGGQPPANPEAWLLTVARRRLVDRARSEAVRARLEIALPADPVAHDERLGLLLVCAHPAIDAAARAPLMLQTVLGLDAARIAGAFLVPAATMSQRLVRAKARIRDLRIPFEVPNDASGRVDDVLDAIYAAYTAGLDGETDLAPEAEQLASLVAEFCPEHAEALGLAALILHSRARAASRRALGRFIPLDQQDTSQWDKERMRQADAFLTYAAALKQPGRYQLEAVIQSVHNARAITGVTDWALLTVVYEGLCAIAPSIGAEIGRAAVLCRTDAAAALRALDGLPEARVADHQPYWAVRAEALLRAQDPRAGAAFQRAAGLSADPSVRAFLLERATGCLRW